MKKPTSILTLISTSLFLASCGGGSSVAHNGSGNSDTPPPSNGGNSAVNPDPSNGDSEHEAPIYYNGEAVKYEVITQAPPQPPAEDIATIFPLEAYREYSVHNSTNPKDYGKGALYNTLVNGTKALPDESTSYRPTEAFFRNEIRPVDGAYHQKHRVAVPKIKYANVELPLSNISEDASSLLQSSLDPYIDYLLEKRTLVPLEVPTLAIPNKAGNLTANRADALLDKVNSEDAKVLIIDQDLTVTSTSTEELVKNKRVTIDYLRDRYKDEVYKPTDSTSHSEQIVNMIAGNMEHKLYKDPHNHKTSDPSDSYLQPLFAKNGKVKIITAFPGNGDINNFIDSIYHQKTLTKAIDEGYTIINESYAASFKEYAEFVLGIKPVPKDRSFDIPTTVENANIPKSSTWLFNNQIIHNRLDLSQVFYRYLNKIYGANSYDFPDLQAKENLIKKKDILFVKSTGNNKEDYSNTIAAIDNYSPFLPAILDGFIAVTSYPHNDVPLDSEEAKEAFNADGTRKNYANPCAQIRNYCLAAYDVGNIKLKKDNKVYSFVGTSFSAPYVASVAGLVKSVFPFMHNSELQQTVLTTAKDIGAKGIDDVYGWGLVQPQDAINGPKAIFRNFVVDFDYRRKSANPEYVFANSIQAYRLANPTKNAFTTYEAEKQNQLNLIIKNPGVLVLSNHNPFDGKTIVTKGATLDLTGSIQGEIFVDKGSHLYSQGLADIVSNKGHIYNYDRQRKSQQANTYTAIKEKVAQCHSETSPAGCLANKAGNLELYTYKSFDNPSSNNFKVSNFTQDADGTLHLYLGDPLLVTNNISLNGTLSIEGLRELYRFNNNPQSFYGLALLSNHTIKGNFTKIDSKALPFTNIAANIERNIYNQVAVDSKNIYYYLVNLQTLDLKAGFMSLNLNQEEQALGKDALANLSALERVVDKESLSSEITSVDHKKALEVAIEATYNLKPKALKSSLQRFAYDKGYLKAGPNSALSSFLTSLKFANAGIAKDTLLAFSGSEYSRTFRNNQALSAFNTNELWVDHGHQQGLTSSYTFQQALANQHYNARSNRLALAYGTADYHLLGALNYSNSSWDNPLSLGKSSSDHKGLNLLASYNYQGYNFGLGLDYNHHHNKVRRELNILGKAYNFTQSLAHDSLDLAFLLAKDLEVNNFLTVSPYLALSYEYHKLGAFQESFSTGGQDFTLGSQAKHYSFVSPLAGVKFYKTINNHLDLLANFSYKFLPKGEVKAQLADQSHNIEQSFSYAADHLFAIKGGLNYHFNKALTLDVKGGVKKLSSYNGWTKELSVKLSYNFFE